MKKSSQILVPLYLAVSVLLLFFPLLLEGTLFFRDIQLLFMPMKSFLANCWGQGQLPLWHPGIFCGSPFLTDIQTGVFYPLSILFYLAPMPYAFNIFVISHFVLASCFVYAIIRHWNRSIPAACLGAMCFTLGGYLVSTANVLNNLQSAIWLPIIFLCFEKSSSRHTIFYGLLTAIFLAIQFLAGEPQLLLFTLVLLFFYNLVVNKQSRWFHRLSKNSMALAAIGALSVLLVAVQLLPTWEMIQNSIRASGFSFEEATRHSLNPLALLQLLGPPTFDIYQSGNKSFSWLLSCYFGLIPLICATTAIVLVQDHRVRFWTVCLCISVFFALGKHTPLFCLAYNIVPFLKAFRFPAKFMFIFAYAIAFLSAFGLDFILEKSTRAQRSTMAVLGLFILAFCIVFTLQATRPDAVAPHVALNWKTLLVICISGFCIMLFMKEVLNGPTMCVLLILLCTVDLVLAHVSLNPVVPATFYTHKPRLLHCLEQTQRSKRLFVQECSWKNAQSLEPGPFFLQHLWRQHLWPNTGTLYNISYVNGIGGIETQYQWFITELLEKLSFSKRIRFLELTHTGHLVAWPNEEIERQMSSGRLKRIQKNLYELPQVMPLAYMVPDVIVAADQAKAIKETLKDDFDSWQCVVLEEGGYVPNTGGGGGQVFNIVAKGPNTMEIAAKSHGGYLVFLDAFYPGWDVLVDGQKREVLRANGLFKAVFLDPGVHKIVFAYRPQSFAWGLRISFISLCLVILGLWVSRPRDAVPHV